MCEGQPQYSTGAGQHVAWWLIHVWMLATIEAINHQAVVKMPPEPAPETCFMKKPRSDEMPAPVPRGL